MGKRIYEKISAAFAEGSAGREYATDYLAEIRTNWRDTEKSIGKVALLMVVMAGVFEVVGTGDATEITLLFVKITDLKLIALSLPVIVAYQYYLLWVLFTESEIFQVAHDEVVRAMWPVIYDQDCERPLHPANSLISSSDRVFYMIGAGTKSGKIADFTVGIRPFVLIIAPPVFLIVAYIQLFERYGPGSPLLWVSLGISGLLAAAAGLSVYVFAQT